MPTVAVVTEDDLQSVPGQPAAGGPVSLRLGTVIQRLRNSLDRVAGQDKVVDQALEEAFRLPNAQSRLQVLAEKLVQAKAVDFACVSLISNLSAFALMAIHGPGAELFPPPIRPCHEDASQHLRAPRRSFSLFHSRRLFHLEGSGWSLQDVAASAAPWYYDCSQQNVHGQPKEAAWLHVAGMRSMVCLPCVHDQRVCGAVLLAARSRRWDSKLLNKLQDVVVSITPLVVEAASDLAPCLAQLHAHRFKSTNEIAGGMIWEMVNLDKILLARIHSDSQEKPIPTSTKQAKVIPTDTASLTCAVKTPAPEPSPAVPTSVVPAANTHSPTTAMTSSSQCSSPHVGSSAALSHVTTTRISTSRNSPYKQIVLTSHGIATAGNGVNPSTGHLDASSTHGQAGSTMPWSCLTSQLPLPTVASLQRQGIAASSGMETSTTCSSSRSSHQATHMQVMPIMSSTQGMYETDVDPLACYGSENLTATGVLSGNAELLTGKLRAWADHSNSQLYSSLCSSGRTPALGYDVPDATGMAAGDGRYVREKTQDLMSRLRGSAAYVAAEQVVYEERHLAAQQHQFMMDNCMPDGGVGLDMTEFISIGDGGGEFNHHSSVRTTGATATTMACVGRWEHESMPSGRMNTFQGLMDSKESITWGTHGSPRPSLHHQNAMLSTAMDCVGRASTQVSPVVGHGSRLTGSRLSVTARLSSDSRDTKSGAAACVAYQSSLYSPSLGVKCVTGAGGVSMGGIPAVHSVERSHLPTLIEEGK